MKRSRALRKLERQVRNKRRRVLRDRRRALEALAGNPEVIDANVPPSVLRLARAILLPPRMHFKKKPN